MTLIELLSLIVGILILVKIITLLVKPQAWMNLSKKITKNTVVFSSVSLVIVIISGYIVLKELGIIQVGAVMLFVSGLMALTGAPFLKKLIGMHEDITKNIFKKAWLSMIIWGVLAVWMIVAAI